MNGNTSFSVIAAIAFASVFAAVGAARSEDRSIIAVEGATIGLLSAPPVSSALLADAIEMSESDRLIFLQIDLEPGWKTYWRLPGRFGLPPSFDWSTSSNLGEAAVHFPAPLLFEEADGQSIGYAAPTLLPIVITPQDSAAPTHLELALELGLCDTLCIPVTVELALVVPAVGSDEANAAPASLTSVMNLRHTLPRPMRTDAENLDGRDDGESRPPFWVLEGSDGRGIAYLGIRPDPSSWTGQGRAIRLFEIIPGQTVRVRELAENDG